MDRESLNYDIVIVGAGPAGLACAIRVKQINPELSICILEKGAEVGAHILSGAVLELRALNELLPDWSMRAAPIQTAVQYDEFAYLSTNKKWELPLPRPM